MDSKKVYPRSLMKRNDPKLQALLELALQHGGRWRTRNKHYIMELPSGRILVLALSPSDYRGMLNKVTQFRRILREEGILEK
jgi:hypothetical protein